MEEKLNFSNSLWSQLDELDFSNGYAKINNFIEKNFAGFRLDNWLKRSDVLEQIEFYKEVENEICYYTEEGRNGGTYFSYIFLCNLLCDLDKFFHCLFSKSLSGGYWPICDDECVKYLENKEYQEYEELSENIKIKCLNDFLHDPLNFKHVENKKNIQIYLINLGNGNYKIGSTKNIEKRMKQFKTTCPNLKLIYSFEGSINVENIIKKTKTSKRLLNSEIYIFDDDDEAINFLKGFKKRYYA